MNRFTIFPAAMLAMSLASCGDAGEHQPLTNSDKTTSQRVESDAVRSGQEVADNARDGAEKFSEMTREQGIVAGDKASELADDTGNAIEDGVTTAAEKTKDGANTAAEKTKDGATTAADKVKEGANATGDAARDAYNSAKEKGGSAWDSIKNKTGNAWEATKDGVTNTYDRANEAITGETNDNTLGLWSHKHSNGHHQSREEWEAHKERVRQNAQKVADRARDGVDTTADRTARVADGLVMEGEDSLNRTSDAVRGTVEDAKDTVNDAYEGAKDNVEDAVDTTKDATYGAVQWTRDRVRGGRQAVDESFRRIGHAADRATHTTKEKVAGTYNDRAERGRQVAEESRAETAAINEQRHAERGQEATAAEGNDMEERARSLSASYGDEDFAAGAGVAAERTAQVDGVRLIAKAICEGMNARRPFATTQSHKYTTMDECLANEEAVYGHKYFGGELCTVHGFVPERLSYCVDVAHNATSSYSLPRGISWFWNCDAEYVCEATP